MRDARASPASTATPRRERSRHLPGDPRLHCHPARRPTAGAASATNGAAGDRLAHPPSRNLKRGRAHGFEERPGPLPRTGHRRRTRPRFGEILTNRLGTTLPAWISAVDAGQLPGLTGFALHLLRDLDAVTAGLTLHWSSGGTEGAVNRIKKIKRQLYGQSGFELLRKMILLQ
ncbi:transposase [Streptomyces sp. NPDC019990]|uniref:transposase n=1 Tax=Streptomyces sp. NPDC019990 TaxID=3154693 RepID=UPI0033CC4164